MRVAETQEYDEELKAYIRNTEYYYNYAEVSFVQDRNMFVEYLRIERKVEQLIHFTRVVNLPNILEKGILPRYMIDDESVEYYSDDKRLDGMPECICFSLSFPNFQMLSKTKNWAERYAVLEMDIDALESDSVEKAYSRICMRKRHGL